MQNVLESCFKLAEDKILSGTFIGKLAIKKGINRELGVDGVKREIRYMYTRGELTDREVTDALDEAITHYERKGAGRFYLYIQAIWATFLYFVFGKE